VGMPAVADGGTIQVPWHARRWTRQGEDEPWAVVEMRLELLARSGTVWLRYDVDHFSRPTGLQEYAVALATTPCRFGGVRWWWLCSATGRRVSKLYLPNGGTRFLSRGRGAYRLAYASQRHGAVDRMHDRSRKLYRQLGADYDGPVGEDWPPKPKGMHWRTYHGRGQGGFAAVGILGARAAAEGLVR
jgi:hypothetical protein